MSSPTKTILGCVLLATACLGFLTVADDLRHTGELFAVLGVLLSGLALLVAGRYPGIAPGLGLQWLPLGVAAGALGGALVDRVAAGVSVGVLLGLLLARLARPRT